MTKFYLVAKVNSWFFFPQITEHCKNNEAVASICWQESAADAIQYFEQNGWIEKKENLYTFSKSALTFMSCCTENILAA